MTLTPRKPITIVLGIILVIVGVLTFVSSGNPVEVMPLLIGFVLVFSRLS